MIYADPPWRYTQKGLQGAAEKHYPTMGMDEICALPVADLAAPNSVLFLWATFPQLPEALRLINAWGFTYKSVAFVWLKKNRKSESWFYGLGFWTRGNAGPEQRAFFVGYVPAAPGGPAADQCVGLYLQKRGVCVAEEKPKVRELVLWLGLLDEGQRGGLPAGDTGTPETAGGKRPSIHYCPDPGAQPKAGPSRTFRVGQSWGAASYLQIMAS